MERGSRLKTLFENLEKLNSGCVGKHAGRSRDEELSQYRYVTSKILQYLETQDKLNRDTIVKNATYVAALLQALQSIHDRSIQSNIIQVFLELVGKTNTGKRASVLVGQGATVVLFNVLVANWKECPTDDGLILIHQLLCKLGPKDRKFGVKARLCQALPVNASLVRQYSTVSHFGKSLQTLLMVMRLLCHNQQNATYLGRNGAISLLFRIISGCGKRHLVLLKITLDTLGQLVKSKSNSARAIGQNGVPLLLDLFTEWYRSDSRNRHVPLRKSILNILRLLANLKSGRCALLEHDGLPKLYDFCELGRGCTDLESMVMQASLILRKCFPRNRLPVNGYFSVLRCPLPESSLYPSPNSGPMGDGSGAAGDLDVDADDSPFDEDDDVSSGEEGGFVEGAGAVGGASGDCGRSGGSGGSRRGAGEEASNEEGRAAAGVYNERSLEDLVASYEKFFPEILEFQAVEQEPADIWTSNLDQSVLAAAEAAANGESRHQSSLRPSSSDSRPDDLSDDDFLTSRPRTNATPGFLNLELSLPSASIPAEEAGDPLESSLRQLRLVESQGGMVTTTGPPRSSLERKLSSELLTSRSVRTSRTSCRLKPMIPTGSASAGEGLQLPFFINAVGAAQSDGANPLYFMDAETKQRAGKSVNEARRRRRKLSAKTRRSSNVSTGGDGLENRRSSVTEPSETYEMSDYTESYVRLSASTRSLGRFSRIGYPDLIGSVPVPDKEYHAERRLSVQQAKIMDDMRRIVDRDDIVNKVVYDLDQIVARDRDCYTCEYSRIANDDETKVDNYNYEVDHLIFDAQFESGNLRRAIQVRQYEYDLVLNPDIGTNHHVQWFYFRVSNIEGGVAYRFNIVNCEKPNSQFNFGMRPLVFSVREALHRRSHWQRMGDQICYYRNHFARSAQTNGGVPGRSYYTASFCITFPHEGDICYIAYHYPYTYSNLRADLELCEKRVQQSIAIGEDTSIFFRCQALCHTILGNEMPLLTITATPRDRLSPTLDQLRSRPYIFICARVHPGESNASWVMRGTINFLLGNTTAAKMLREQFIFKIVPMLNPDGVISGNHRCSMAAEDLNRKWLHPCPNLHPTIYHTKGLMAYMHKTNRSPFIFCDYHGHSRKKNVFMYGCSPCQSWIAEDADNPSWLPDSRQEDPGYKVLPRLLHQSAPCFSLPSCSYVVEKQKETTARVVVWRQFRVLRSYTMESTYCGCDQGIYRGVHITTRELEEMGAKFCEALLRIRNRHANAAVAATAASLSRSNLAAASSSFMPSVAAPSADFKAEKVSNLGDINDEMIAEYEDDSDDTGDSGEEDWFEQSDGDEIEEC